MDEQTEAAIAALQPQITRLEKRLLPTVRKDLAADPATYWAAPVGKMAEKLAVKLEGVRRVMLHTLGEWRGEGGHIA